MLGSPEVLHKKPSYPLERQRGETMWGGRDPANAYCCIQPLSSGGGFTAISVSDTRFTFFWQLCNLDRTWLGKIWMVVTRADTFSRLAGAGSAGMLGQLGLSLSMSSQSSFECGRRSCSVLLRPGPSLVLLPLEGTVHWGPLTTPLPQNQCLSNCHVHRSYLGVKWERRLWLCRSRVGPENLHF